jgi:histidyl-tRNA synthetase
MTKAQTLKGFRDFLPEDMAIRNYVKNTLIETIEKSGFLPIETPALEYSSVLKGKYSNETDNKLGYFFKDNGDRDIGLRYDLTVPTAKVLAIYGNNQIKLPFKRYQVQPVWRAENTQKGRYREFVQCDMDIFGSSSPIADSEIIYLVYQSIKKLAFKNAVIKINSRPLLLDILAKSNVKNEQSSVLQSVDKLEKIGENRVKDELASKGLSTTQIVDIFKYIKLAQPDNNLKQIFDNLEALQIPKSAYIFDPTLVRGCDYYTGVIFEVSVTEPKIGAIGGGGRYDNLISTLGGPQVPAVGFAFGFERIVDVIKELNLLPQVNKTKIKILITNFGQESQKETLLLKNQLDKEDICSTLYPDSDKMAKQIKYALNMGIRYVAIVGSDEVKDKKITIKDLEKEKQQTVTFNQLIKILK